MGDVLEFKPRPKPAAKAPLPPNEKRDALMRLLDVGVAMIHLDPRLPGVVVPAEHSKTPHLRLNLSWGFKIHELDIGAEKIVASLSFSGRNFRCELPWSAIFAITSETRKEMSELWLSEIPDELGKPSAG